MLVIWPDSNALIRNPYLQSRAGERMMALVKEGKCELRISSIVIAETRRKYLDQLAEAERKAEGALNQAVRYVLRGHHDGLHTPENLEWLTHTFRVARGGVELWLEQLLNRDGIREVQTAAISSRDIVARELERRRPFLRDRATGTVGHLDTMIWLTALGYLREHADATVIFVSADKGFVEDDGSLHAHLLEDLEIGGLTGRLLLVNELDEAADLVDLAFNSLSREELTLRRVYRNVLNWVSDYGAFRYEHPSWDPEFGTPNFDQWLEHIDIGLPKSLRRAFVVGTEYEGNDEVLRNERYDPNVLGPEHELHMAFDAIFHIEALVDESDLPSLGPGYVPLAVGANGELTVGTSRKVRILVGMTDPEDADFESDFGVLNIHEI